jgi:hypothetical protein
MYKYIPNEINGRHPIAIREKKTAFVSNTKYI